MTHHISKECIGISLLIGDGVITPAISILSSVEGIRLLEPLQGMKQGHLLLVAAGIAVLLFAIQKKGGGKVSVLFGPVMLLWFLALAVSGLVSLVQVPVVLKAVNPYYAVSFLAESGIKGFFILSEVILCATGGEALYADMGHLGRKPILRAWYFVFSALVLNYLVQGAYMVQNPKANMVLFEMVRHQADFLYVPFLALSLLATVIVSQAMISGIFSIVYQAIRIRALPMLNVTYTSREHSSQIYIGFVNACLLAAVLWVMFRFQASHNLAAAYGLAVTGTMTITGILMTWIFSRRRDYGKALIALLVTGIDFVFLFSNLEKLPHGGFWSLAIAAVPLLLILLYTYGRRRLLKAFRPMAIKKFLRKFDDGYANKSRIQGTALFLVQDIGHIPAYVVRTIFTNGILYEQTILVSIRKREGPFGISWTFGEDLTQGLKSFEIMAGYMEVVDVQEILEQKGINERAIFYGLMDIHSRNPVLSLFAKILRLTPSFVRFYKFPAAKLHGVNTRFDL